jgi:hypothetical protein
VLPKRVTKAWIKKSSSEDLVRVYEKAASDNSLTERGNVPAGNRAADRAAAIYRELRQRGRDHQLLLLPLLDSSDLYVRKWAAAHALEFAPEKGLPVLELLSKEPPWIGLSAEITLGIWRKGELRFP